MTLDDGWDALLDAMTQRSLDLIAARTWLHHFGETARAITADSHALTVPQIPVVDADGDPVVVALCWWLAGVPFFIIEFDNGERRCKVYVEGQNAWRTLDGPEWERLLLDGHSRGLFAPPPGDDGTGGTMAGEGVVGITVVRDGKSIPVDPKTGLASGIVSVADEAERFLRDNTAE